MTQEYDDKSQGFVDNAQTAQTENTSTKKSQHKKMTKAEQLAKLEARKNAIEAMAARIETRIKRLEKTKDELRKDDGRRKVIAGATALKMIREDQEFTADKYKQAVISAAKKDEDKDFFRKIFKIEK